MACHYHSITCLIFSKHCIKSHTYRLLIKKVAQISAHLGLLPIIIYPTRSSQLPKLKLIHENKNMWCLVIDRLSTLKHSKPYIIHIDKEAKPKNFQATLIIIIKPQSSLIHHHHLNHNMQKYIIHRIIICNSPLKVTHTYLDTTRKA